MYIANRPTKFGGKLYYIGETIPDELIAKDRAATLCKYGTISYVKDIPPVHDHVVEQDKPNTIAESVQDAQNQPEEPAVEQGDEIAKPDTKDAKKTDEKRANSTRNHKERPPKKGA